MNDRRGCRKKVNSFSGWVSDLPSLALPFQSAAGSGDGPSAGRRGADVRRHRRLWGPEGPRIPSGEDDEAHRGVRAEGERVSDDVMDVGWGD